MKSLGTWPPTFLYLRKKICKNPDSVTVSSPPCCPFRILIKIPQNLFLLFSTHCYRAATEEK